MTNFYKIGQENTIEMCFPFNQWISDKTRQYDDEILQNQKKVDKVQQQQQS